EHSRVHDLPVLMPIDEPGRMLPGYGELEGRTTDAVEEPIVESLHERGLLVASGRIRHRYPICWRCKTPLVFRVVDDWFISAEEIRRPMLDATTRCNGRRRSTRSGWTTGYATWATGTSRGSASSACRCRSIRASAAGSTSSGLARSSRSARSPASSR